jgi:hypothetical protein
MSQVSDFATANGSGLQVRTGFNNVNAAIVTKNSGSVAPTDIEPYMSWFDTAPANAEWNVRNGANAAWIKLAEEIGGNLRLFSDGAAIPSVGAANIFTADQKIRLAAAIGQMIMGSQLTTGIASRLSMIGNNSAAAETIYAKLEADIESNSAGAEAGRLLLSLIRGGSQQEILRLGSGVQLGSPAGGLKGLGSLNLESLFIENVDINTAIAAASNAAWQTATHSTSPQNLNLSTFRNFDLTISTIDVTLNFLTPTTQIGRVGLIRLNNTSGGDRTITLSNANSVEIAGGFTTDGTTIVSSGQEKWLLFIAKSATLVNVFEFVGETVVSGNGFSSFVQYDLTAGESSDALLRLQAISDGETQRVVVHDLFGVLNQDDDLLVRVATVGSLLLPGAGTYDSRGDTWNGSHPKIGIAIADVDSNSIHVHGEFTVRRTGTTLWVNSGLNSGRLSSAGKSTHKSGGTFFGDSFTHWTLDLEDTNNPASGSKWTVYRDVA